MLKVLVKILPFFLIFAAVLVFYYPVFGVYFSQDDFFSFKVSQTDGSFKSFINLFGFHPFEVRKIAFYRPIFRELLFNVYYTLFGLNHLPFRILQFTLHFLNIYLVYLLVQKIFKLTELSLFTALFFGISAANVAVLYYLTGGIQTLGATLFILLTLIFFWKYLEGDGARFKILASITFLLDLASHEQAAVTPFLMTGLILIKQPLRKALPIIVREVWVYFFVLAIYLYLDFTKIGYSHEQQYQTVFSIKRVLNTFAWYSVWALGVPEMLIDWVRPGLKLNPSLMRYWSDYYYIIFPTFFLSVFIFLTCLVYVFSQKVKLLKDKRLFFLVLWFIITLLPVAFLPLHKSTYYLLPALPAFWAVVGYIIFNYKSLRQKESHLPGVILAIFIVSAFLLSFTSARLGNQTYWAAARGRLAGQLIREIKEKYPTLPPGAGVYIKNDPRYPFVADEWGGTSKQAAYVLNNEDALRLFYKDPTLEVYYEDLRGVPKDMSKVFEITAKIN